MPSPTSLSLLLFLPWTTRTVLERSPWYVCFWDVVGDGPFHRARQQEDQPHQLRPLVGHDHGTEMRQRCMRAGIVSFILAWWHVGDTIVCRSFSSCWVLWAPAFWFSESVRARRRHTFHNVNAFLAVYRTTTTDIQRQNRWLFALLMGIISLFLVPCLIWLWRRFDLVGFCCATDH